MVKPQGIYLYEYPHRYARKINTKSEEKHKKPGSVSSLTNMGSDGMRGCGDGSLPALYSSSWHVIAEKGTWHTTCLCIPEIYLSDFVTILHPPDAFQVTRPIYLAILISLRSSSSVVFLIAP
jgi:hypothetical protein